jgi:hypothetical protein
MKAFPTSLALFYCRADKQMWYTLQNPILCHSIGTILNSHESGKTEPIFNKLILSYLNTGKVNPRKRSASMDINLFNLDRLFTMKAINQLFRGRSVAYF